MHDNDNSREISFEDYRDNRNENGASGRTHYHNPSSYHHAASSKQSGRSEHTVRSYKPYDDYRFDERRYARRNRNHRDNSMVERKGNGKRLAVVVLIIIVCALAAIACGYAYGAEQYNGRFLPNTVIQGVDVSGDTPDEAYSKLIDEASKISVTVADGDSTSDITGSDVDMTVDRDGISSLCESQSKWNWLSAKLTNSKASSENHEVGTSYDRDKLAEKVAELPCVTGAGRTKSVNATVKYDDASKAYVAVPEVNGNIADKDVLVEMVTSSMDNGGGSVSASEAFIKPDVVSSDDSIVNAVNTLNSYADKTITYNIDGIQGAETLDHDKIVTFLTVNDDLSVGFNEKTIRSWTHEIGKKYDTAGTERTYTTVYGKTATIPAGTSTYGWVTDEAGMVPVVEDNIKSSDSSLTQDYKYKSTAAGPKGGAEWGDTYVDLDKTEQHIRFVQNGSVAFECDTVTGSAPKHDTPEGLWTILDKQTDYTMVGSDENGDGEPDYRTPCSYWMRFTWSGCGFHDLASRSNWSNTAWLNNAGSHGCANMHLNDAKTLYGLVNVGTPVIIHK